MERIGEVTKVDGDQLEVTVCRPEECEKCNACLGPKMHTVQVTGYARLGDQVVVDIPKETLVKASLLAYLMPLIALLAGMVLGYVLSGQQEIFGVVGALVGLGLSASVLVLSEKKRKQDPRWKPQLKQIL